jgi:hypothetical protein
MAITYRLLHLPSPGGFFDSAFCRLVLRGCDDFVGRAGDATWTVPPPVLSIEGMLLLRAAFEDAVTGRAAFGGHRWIMRHERGAATEATHVARCQFGFRDGLLERRESVSERKNSTMNATVASQLGTEFLRANLY